MGRPVQRWRTVGTFPRYFRQSSINCVRADSGVPGFCQNRTKWINMARLSLSGGMVGSRRGLARANDGFTAEAQRSQRERADHFLRRLLGILCAAAVKTALVRTASRLPLSSARLHARRNRITYGPDER